MCPLAGSERNQNTVGGKGRGFLRLEASCPVHLLQLFQRIEVLEHTGRWGSRACLSFAHLAAYIDRCLIPVSAFPVEPLTPDYWLFFLSMRFVDPVLVKVSKAWTSRRWRWRWWGS